MSNQTDLVLTATREHTVIRTGRVVNFSSNMLVVEISGVRVRAGYLASYGPTEGDLVALAVQDASWLVLGKIAGVAS